MHTPSGQGQERRQRAQSSPLGLVLVFALVIAATTLVVLAGTTAITSTQGQLDSEQTEKALTQLDSQAALVALGDSDRQRVDLSASGAQQYRTVADAGRMTLSYENLTTGTETTIFSTPMGALVHEGADGTTTAYQGGGVWRTGRDGGAVMVSPPEFHYRDATLTLPLITIGSTGSVGNRAAITRRTATQYFPNESYNGNFTNPLENGRVEVTVTSEYYRAWGTFFETRTEGQVTYDHPNERVTLVLVTPLENTRVTSASASLSASGTFEINGGTNTLCGPDVYTNSYDSSGTDDDYCAQTPGDNGTVVYGGDVDISTGAGGDDIRGDIISGGTVTVGKGGGKPHVYGNISYSDNCNPSPSDCADRITSSTGTVSQINGIDQAPSINGIVQARVDDALTDNDNAGTGNVSGTTLNYTNAGSADTVELAAGTYYLTNIDVGSSETVVLNTTDDDIVIVVAENVALADDANVTVAGDGIVNVFVSGTGGNTNQLYMGSASEITNSGDDAPQFRLFGRDNFTARLGSGAGGNLAKYVGVIFAPPGTTGTGSVTLDGGTVYGGVLTGRTTIDGGNGGSIHYDEALRTQRVLERSESVVRVTYIHASTNEVAVTSD